MSQELSRREKIICTAVALLIVPVLITVNILLEWNWDSISPYMNSLCPIAFLSVIYCIAVLILVAFSYG